MSLIDSIDDPSTNPPMMSSVAKVVQPTATATSVPVSGPSMFCFQLFSYHTVLYIY